MDLSPAARAWLDDQRASCADPERFFRAFTAAARKVGVEQEPVRIALLAEAVRSAPDDAAAVALVKRAYDDGDGRERCAVLRALHQLPGPERFLPVAVESCRTHVLPVFEAIACDNPYPSAYFPDLAFNQMALKAAFVELPLSRIVGLASRRTADLERMARDYAGERQAAGRPVPSDLHLLHQ